MLKKYQNHLLLHLIVFIWGFTGILGKLITLPALDLVWIRMIIAVVFIAAYAKYKKQSFALSTAKVIRYGIVGSIICLHWIFFYQSIKIANISVAVVCLSSATFFTAILDPIINKTKLILYELLLGIAVIIALYVIFDFENKYFAGLVTGIASAFFSALFTVLNGRLTKQENSEILSVYELGGGWLLFTIYLIFTGGFHEGFFDISALNWFYLLLLSTVCTAFAFVASVQVMKTISPFTVVLSINLEPVYSIILAFYIFGEEERMTTTFYTGTFLILLTIVVNAILKHRSASYSRELPI